MRVSRKRGGGGVGRECGGGQIFLFGAESLRRVKLEFCFIVVMFHCGQAALLWRCTELFKDGVVEQSGFKQLFANIVTVDRAEAKLLQESCGLQRMMASSGAVQNDGMVNIQEFVVYHYVPTSSDPPLDDEIWNHELFRQYLESRQHHEARNKDQ